MYREERNRRSTGIAQCSSLPSGPLAAPRRSIGMPGRPLMDPYTLNETINNAINNHLFDTLVETDNNLQPKPSAESWEVLRTPAPDLSPQKGYLP